LNNLALRLITGSVYVGVTCLALLWRHESALIFHLLVAGFCAYELLRLISPKQSTLNRLIGTASTLAVSGFAYINQDSLINAGYFNNIFIFVGLLFMAYVLLTSKNDPISYLGGLMVSWIYIGVSLGLFFRIGQMELGGETMSLLPFDGGPILFVFVLIWVNDSFAYVFGRLLGRHKLAPSISPKKTIEGFVGGLIASVAVGYFFGTEIVPIEDTQLAVFGAVISLSANLGDLFESKIKRTLGVKDSGTALPGHGGFLDRFDSVLFAGPAAYAFLLFFVN